MASLRLVPVSGEPIEVTRDQSLVGREPSCEIVVSDGSVSRRHARLERRGATWFVVDQGSANGTYVNSLKVAEHALKNGQELRFGALAFRVDLLEDPEATVAQPILPEQTVMATATPPPMPVAPPLIPPIPSPPVPHGVGAPPPPRAASAPPPPPSAAAARDRFRPAGTPPVPPMAAGAPPAKKGKGPLFWIAIGCCGCVLLVALLAGALGGGAYFMSKGAADAAHGWLGEIRKGQLDEAYAGGLSAEYKTQLSREDFERLGARLGKYGDATFWHRSIDNDRAVLKGVLTAKGGPPQPITLKLVKEGGAWKIDEVDFGVDR